MYKFEPNAPTRPCSHLTNIIRDTRDHHPNFVLFLGAGASASSGVPTATQLISEWRLKFRRNYPDYQEEKTPYQDSPEEYSKLFEILYDQQSQRREFIETKIGDATPSWGYIYLTNLIRNNVFNTIFTTNFDDLLNEACYQFTSDLRPIVCAHDSSIKYVRITSKRPKIVKLHGDFLFDNIKNTVRELETLEENMKNKFRQFASEFGFVFLGYSGNDRTVMDAVNTLVRSDGYFPHGIYWCVRKNQTLSSGLQELAKNPRVCLIEVDGFDEFCVDLHSELRLTLQKEVLDPYGSLTDRLNTLLDQTKIQDGGHEHPIIKLDVQRLAERIAGVGDQSTQPIQIQNVPLLLLAQASLQSGDFESSFKYAFSEVKRSKSQRALEVCFSSVAELTDSEKAGELIRFLDENISIISERPGTIHNFVVSLLNAKMYESAEQLLEVGSKHFGAESESYSWAYHQINLGQTYRHQGKEIPEPLRADLVKISEESSNPYSRFGAFLVLGNESAAIEQLQATRGYEGHNIEDILKWPISDLFSDEAKASLLSALQEVFRSKSR